MSVCLGEVSLYVLVMILAIIGLFRCLCACVCVCGRERPEGGGDACVWRGGGGVERGGKGAGEERDRCF